MTECDGPNCVRTWKRLPKRGFVLTGKGRRYRFCTLTCLEQALVAGLGVKWPEPAGKRNFKERYWQARGQRCSAVNPSTLELLPPWPHEYEDALFALAKLRDAIKPGRLDRLLAAAAREIRRAARKAAQLTSRYGR